LDTLNQHLKKTYPTARLSGDAVQDVIKILASIQPLSVAAPAPRIDK
jgi:hypothetical protein